MTAKCYSLQLILVLGRNSVRILIKKKELEKLKKIPAPTYLAGVDVKSRKVYLGYISLEMQKLNHIPLKNELTLNSLQELHDEITKFWKSMPQQQIESRFKL